MNLAVLKVVFLSILSATTAQSQWNCSLLEESELGSTESFTNRGLLAEALIAFNQGGDGEYQLVQYNIVCLAQGSGRGQYSMVSVIACYLRRNTAGEMLAQFHFECVSGQWSITVLDIVGVVTTSAEVVGNLSTPVRTDCRLCIDLSGGGVDAPSATPAEHCIGKYLQ